MNCKKDRQRLPVLRIASKTQLARLTENINAPIETILTANIIETNQLMCGSCNIEELGMDTQEKTVKDF